MKLPKIHAAYERFLRIRQTTLNLKGDQVSLWCPDKKKKQTFIPFCSISSMVSIHYHHSNPMRRQAKINWHKVGKEEGDQTKKIIINQKP